MVPPSGGPVGVLLHPFNPHGQECEWLPCLVWIPAGASSITPFLTPPTTGYLCQVSVSIVSLGMCGPMTEWTDSKILRRHSKPLGLHHGLKSCWPLSKRGTAIEHACEASQGAKAVQNLPSGAPLPPPSSHGCGGLGDFFLTPVLPPL